MFKTQLQQGPENTKESFQLRGCDAVLISFIPDCHKDTIYMSMHMFFSLVLSTVKVTNRNLFLQFSEFVLECQQLLSVS